MLQVSSDDEAEATDEEEEGNTGGEGNAADGDSNQNADDNDKMDLRDVFDDPNDDGITEAIAEAEAEAQREHQEEEAEAVAGQYMAEAMNIPLSELSVGSSTESAKDARRERHVSKQFYTFGCCIVTFYSIMVRTTYVYVCKHTYITLKVYKYEHVNPCI